MIVWQVRWNDTNGTLGCNNDQTRIHGFVNYESANCGYFEASGEDGINQMHYESEGSWPNYRCADQDPLPLKQLVVINAKRRCNIGNLRLEIQCDGYALSRRISFKLG